MPPARLETLVKPAALEDQRGLLAAGSGAAVDDDFVVLVRGELADAAFDGAYGDQRRAEVGDRVLVRLADVEDEDVFFGVELALELPRR